MGRQGRWPSEHTLALREALEAMRVNDLLIWSGNVNYIARICYKLFKDNENVKIRSIVHDNKVYFVRVA